MMIRKIALSWMVIGSLLLAQKITNIKFEGLAHLSKSVAYEVAGIRPGDNVTSEQIDDSVKNFYDQGYFEDVWVEQKGSTLIYHFNEKRAIAKVKVTGYGDDGKKLLEGAGIKKGDLYDVMRIEQAKKAMQAALEAKGNYDSVIDVTTKPVGKHAVAVTFDVNKGEKIKIKKINFIGAKALSKSELEHNLVNQQEDALGFIPIFFHNGEVKVDQLPYDAYRVKETYMEHGYLDAYVSKPLMRVDYSSYTAEVDYQIKEGKQYRLGKISISQSIPGLKTENLLSDLDLRSGKVFNITKMRKDIKMLENKAGNLGYAYAKVTPNMHKDPQKGIVDIQYIITPGQKVKIGDVLISGNDETKDRVIRRYIYLAPGDLYSSTDLKESINALKRTGFFEKVDIQTQRISEDKVNLLVKVKETQTGTISAGGGYGSYEGLMVNASISDRNFLGTGINTTLGFEFSKVSKNYNLSFVNPRVWDSRYSLGLSLYKRKYEYNYDQTDGYTIDQLGGSVNVGREFWRHFYASVGVGYVDNQSEYSESYLESVNSISNQFYNDQYRKASGFASLKFDNTDDYLLPREGYIASVAGEFSKMDGDMTPENLARGYTKFDSFTKVNARFGAFYGMEDLIDYDLILRFKARYTKIFSLDDEYIPIAEKLFMGGVGSVRGYNPYSLSPDVIGKGGIPGYPGSRIGGTERESASFEANIPLSDAAKMRLSFFYDIGRISTDAVRSGVSPSGQVEYIDFNNPDQSYYGASVVRSSTGAVVEWQSPFGAINLIFSYAINPDEYDDTATFEFSMGNQF
ncbi:Outer membrane protein assembly factor YaeT precursor [hydrothermal vent metagenome]|uniref:Outer membrane protein assembly factor YaeT n=1 Tax=hydrothermal vent metagenome TaxID=652676 RepID=A0A1W1BK37_9ZZZZ